MVRKADLQSDVLESCSLVMGKNRSKWNLSTHSSIQKLARIDKEASGHSNSTT